MENIMARVIPTGTQSFLKLRQKNLFYVDKTKFIQDWWDREDDVTLVTRPRRFGKTLMLDTINTFFSPEFDGRKDLFEGLDIWKNEKFRAIQGKIPVVFISFATVKAGKFDEMVRKIKSLLVRIYNIYRPVIDFNLFSDTELEQFTSVRYDMSDDIAQGSIRELSRYLTRQFGVKAIILLDEYDTPMQEAWLNDYWDEAAEFFRGLFNETFKTNEGLGRGLLTGITRVSKESLFSDLNNLEVVTTTSDLYEDCFGFTEDEVFAAMDEYGLADRDEVRRWYDGFIFGTAKGIYNPWSIIGYLKHRRFAPYWAQTSSNAMVGQIIGSAEREVKEQAEDLLQGKSIAVHLDEDLVFSQLHDKEGAVWSFLMAAGYVKPLRFDPASGMYELALVNREVLSIMEALVSGWFNSSRARGGDFRKALLAGDLDDMNELMADIAENTFSFFDTGGRKPERFYHAFVLGLIVDLKGSYEIVSNRESGLGRCDVMLFPLRKGERGIVIEFKTMRPRKEKSLEDTCASALRQIAEKRYADALAARGVARNAIYAYGF
ncbi:MAG: AAA family ATPase, partial [Desulfovibrio sp.]|nr:AAA family ATPase [Desulfovibrio sp.]